MKAKILTTTCLAIGIAGVLAQGQVDFSNLPTKFGDGVDRIIYDDTGAPASAGIKLGLTVDGTAVDVGTAAILGNGIFIGGTKNIPAANPASVQLVVSAWDPAFGTFAEAQTAGALHGMSEPFSYAVPATGAPPADFLMSGMRSFSLVVPEPSTIALGVLGLGALLLFRRRK